MSSRYLHEPKLIILDEPFSGLDPVNTNLIKDEIFQLAQNGSTIIFSTHRMEQVEEICDHIVLVNKGKKILDGTVKEIKQDFKENLFSVGMEQLPVLTNGNAPFEVVGTRDHSFIVRINKGDKPNDVLQYLLQQGAHIYSFNEMLPSLNDIFIKLVEGTPVTRQFQTVKSLIYTSKIIRHAQDIAHHKKRIPDKGSQKDFYYFNFIIPHSLYGTDLWHGLSCRIKQAESSCGRY